MRTFEVNWITNKGTERTIKFVSLADAQNWRKQWVLLLLSVTKSKQ